MKNLIFILCLLIGTPSLYAALTISNPDFEADGSDGSSTTLTSWFEEAEDPNIGGRATSEQALDADINTNIPGTNNMWGHLSDKNDSSFGDPAIYQLLGTWSSGDPTIYNFGALLGDRSNQPYMALTIEFFSVDAFDGGVAADGSPFSSVFSTASLLATDVTPAPNGGSGVLTEEYLSLFDFDLSSLQDGDTIWLRISGSNSDGSASGQRHGLIDDLTLSPLPVIPEPSTYAAMLVGLIALGVAYNRRRR